MYSCAATKFVRDGGDGYDNMKLGHTIDNHLNGTKVDAIFVAWLERRGEVSPTTDGRILIMQDGDSVSEFAE